MFHSSRYNFQFSKDKTAGVDLSSKTDCGIVFVLLLFLFLLFQTGGVGVEVHNVSVQHDVVFALLAAQPSGFDSLPVPIDRRKEQGTNTDTHTNKSKK